MKRAIALLLAFVFVFALIPVSALAANYTLTVTGGSITDPSGKSSPMTFDDTGAATNPQVGANVTVKASSSATKVFQKWTAVPSSLLTDAEKKAESITFALPASDVTLEAVFGNPVVTVAAGCTLEVQGAMASGLSAEAVAGNLIKVTAPATDANGGRLCGFTAAGASITEDIPNNKVTFDMPLANVTVTPKYEYPVTVKLGVETVATWYQKTGATETSAEMTIPDDKYVTGATSTAGTATIVDQGHITLADTTGAIAGPVTVTLAADPLYLVTHTNSTLAVGGKDVKKGDYVKPGAKVTLTASDPGAGDHQVASWTNTGSLTGATVDAAAGTLKFDMPAFAVTTAPSYQYKLTLTNATAVNAANDAAIATGAYVAPGTSVKATATTTAGQVFSKWTSADMTLSTAEEKANPLTFTMPEKAVTLASASETDKVITIKPDGMGTYTFNGGPAQTSGHQVTGDVLTITAPAVSGSKLFLEWTVTNGNGVFADKTSRTTTYTVGDGDGATTQLTPTYVAQVVLRVTNKYGATILSTKDYTFKAGDKDVSMAAQVISGYSFASWSCTDAKVTGLNAVTTTPATISIDSAATGTIAVTANYLPHYTLTVNGVEAADITINGAAASATANTIAANSTISIKCSEIGARVFSGWTVSPDMASTVDLSASQKTLTFRMPAHDQTITANYSASSRQEYQTGAYLEVLYNGKVPSVNNQRYYAVQEFIHKSGQFTVRFYKGGDATSYETIAASDLTYYVAPTGTSSWFDGTNAGLQNTGVFDLKVQYWVGGKLIATSVVYSKAVTVLAARPEIIILAQAPTNTSMYVGDEIDMEGSEVWLRAADKNNGISNYYNVRELTNKEYTVWPQWSDSAKTYRYADGSDAVKTDSKGKYIEIVLAYDDPTQSYAPMQWIKPTDGKDRIDLTETAVAGSLELIASGMVTAGTSPDVVTPATNTATSTTAGKWNMHYGVTGTRYLTANFTRPATSTADMDTFISGWTNSDPSVARITATTDPLKYKIDVVSSGETTVTVTLKGTGEKASFKLHVISTEDENTTPVQSFELNPASLDLYVGSRFALTAKNFSPSTAATVISKWESVYADGTDASYCVSVDETGTVTVNSYTNEKIYIRAYPKYSTVSGYYQQCELTIREVAVTNMTLSPTVLTMYNKASKQLTATILPDGATDKTVKWSTSDSTVASVDSNGIVTANKVGTATITATSVNNASVKKTCAVTVVSSILATSLELSRTSLTLGLNETTTLTAYVSPANATTQTVTWSSDNTGVAKVDSAGKVTSITAGIATITARLDDGSGLTASCLVTVSKIISNAVTLNKQTLALIAGDNEQLTATVFPTNVTTTGVKWTTSNSAVATVDNNGVVVGVGGGAAIITATANDGSGKYADCVVAVTPKIAVDSITLNLASFSLLLNDSTTLTAGILPRNATYGKLAWSSSDTNVATVDENGKVSGLKLGNTIITCKAGDKSVSITVTVANTIYSAGTVVNCARRVNVRSKASGASKAVGYAYLGDTYKVLNKTGRWYYIQYNATTQAYIWDSYLNSSTTTKGYTSAGAATGTATPAPGTTAAPVTGKTVTIINCANCVNVRSGAGTTYSWVGYANLGETYTYTNLTNGFYEIAYGDTTAYVSASFAKANG